MQGCERWTPAYERLFDPDHELAGDEANRRWAFLELCHIANYKKGNRVVQGTLVPLERGELVASLRWMAERWNWSVKRVRSFVDLLTDPAVNKLEPVRGTPVGTVYRVVEYDTYANPGHSEAHGEGHGKSHGEGTGRAQRTTSNIKGTTENPPPIVPPLWKIWKEECFNGNSRHQLTQKRRTKLKLVWDEQLDGRDEPEEFFRKMVKAMLADEWWGDKPDTHLPEKAMRNTERREKWALRAEDGRTDPEEFMTPREKEDARRRSLRLTPEQVEERYGDH